MVYHPGHGAITMTGELQAHDRGDQGPAIRYVRVANRLRPDIIPGPWRPDARLKIRELAAHYGVSPAPIRESLQQLQGEGLVVMEPNRGARVRPITEQLII